MVSEIEYICCPSDWKLFRALPIAIGTRSMCWNNFGEGRERSYISLKRGVGGKIPPFVLIRCLYIYLWACIVLYCTVYRLYIYLWVWARRCSSLLSSNTHFTPYSSDLFKTPPWQHHHIPRFLIIQDIQWNQTHQSSYKYLHWIFNHNKTWLLCFHIIVFLKAKYLRPFFLKFTLHAGHVLFYHCACFLTPNVWDESAVWLA